jgi:hypothetical protein
MGNCVNGDEAEGCAPRECPERQREVVGRIQVRDHSWRRGIDDEVPGILRRKWERVIVRIASASLTQGIELPDAGNARSQQQLSVDTHFESRWLASSSFYSCLFNALA